MKERKSYMGTLNGINGIWCDQKPEGLEVEEEVSVYYPDQGKIFIKNNEKYTSVILKENETIEDYQEIVDEEENKDDIITR